MAYKSKSILQVIKDIEGSKIYLPALQRKFVWRKPQIEMLFDSLMRNFPIGTFLFWNLDSKVAQNYVFYDFLKEYDQRNPYNKRKEGVFLVPEITGVLDGQQRLSSMYIGLQGTHTEKAPYYRWGNENAYRKSRLFLNLLSLPYFTNEDDDIEINEEKNFEFRFLTDEESTNWISRKTRAFDDDGNEITQDENMYWFKVGNILGFGKDPEYDKVIDGFILLCKNEHQKKVLELHRRFVRKAIETLYKRILSEELINYFEVDKTDLEDILKIFIRVNSGGTQLNKTDLLFSTIVATWEKGREEIEDLLKKINKKGDGFEFSNEYLMRCCLVLTDAPVLYKVNSFKSENVQKIKDEWPKIAKAIEETVNVLVEFGFSQNVLTSQNATILIGYYIYKGGIINNITKLEIKKYLIHALLNGVYGSSQDSLITTLRSEMREESVVDGLRVIKLKNLSFSFAELLKIKLPSRKTLYVSESELDGFLNYKKGASSFFVLSLLYPNLRYKEVQFHQDHIHPFSKFTKEILDELGLTNAEQEEWLNLRDTVPNLQLLEGRQNESKNNSHFIDWLSKKTLSQQNTFKTDNYIPEDESLEFGNFISFFEKRKIKLMVELKKVLSINNDKPPSQAEFLEQETETDDDMIDQ